MQHDKVVNIKMKLYTNEIISCTQVSYIWKPKLQILWNHSFLKPLSTDSHIIYTGPYAGKKSYSVTETKNSFPLPKNSRRKQASKFWLIGIKAQVIA